MEEDGGGGGGGGSEKGLFAAADMKKGELILVFAGKRATHPPTHLPTYLYKKQPSLCLSLLFHPPTHSHQTGKVVGMEGLLAAGRRSMELSLQVTNLTHPPTHPPIRVQHSSFHPPTHPPTLPIG